MPPISSVTENLEKAPEFSLSDADGKMVSLSDYRGKKVIISFYRGFW
ncbi:MAG: redoxin domain-containing protein [Verrucomicrobiales bacterium]|nr:redoxin domain-containing protein [Verrucomicrobiales bacterium]